MPTPKPKARAATAVSRPTAELLFEIGTEELPYQFVRPALAALEEQAVRLFKEHRLSHGAVHTLGTPRRLVLVVEDLAGHQEPVIAEILGPPKSVAVDAAGAPTKAALGFAASQQVAVEALETRHTPKGEYLCAVKRDPGRPTAAVLADLLPGLLASLSFPKSMRWNASGLRFARPIRWLLALYNGRVVDVRFGGLTAGSRTWGHRVLGSKGPSDKRGLAVKNFKEYIKALERRGVIPDQDRRQAMIVDQLTRLAKSARGVLHRDEDLLEQAVFTVEYPHAIQGSFNPTYLTVPKEVLMTAMKEHQGFFSLVRKDGGLLPAFLSVTNMKLSDMRLIREGNERVLAARLADAKFFFDEDRKVPLAERVEKLKGVTFHQKLGSVYQKTERVRDLAGSIAEMAGEAELAGSCRRAAELSKADLLTGLVGEFPTLQGVMGGEYAAHDGESEVVSRAIRDHYLPKAMEGPLPETAAGMILSLADRLDTIAAMFHVGIVPTGSEDPLALRRHASAIVRLIVEGGLSLDLAQALALATDLVQGQGFKKAGSSSPLEFIADRLRYYARTTRGLREDVIDAVLKPALQAEGGRLDLGDLLARMTALHEIAARPEFDPLMVGFKRAHRIVEKEKWAREDIDPGLFQHPAESELFTVVQDAGRSVPEAVARREYGAALHALVAMKPAIDAFFTGVLVNADDERLRANRLSLLASVDRVFLTVADFSQIAVQGA
ncbi:glycine--tRNA ligase subunit beta [Candidatus Nitrospira bockiana]